MKTSALALVVAFAAVAVFAKISIPQRPDPRRNGYMLDETEGLFGGLLDNPLYDHGFDWWWHSFVGINSETGEFQPFFIAYYAINEGLAEEEPVLGQEPKNLAQGKRPSYAMIKAGTWAENASLELHNFFPFSEFSAAIDYMDVHIGPHYANDSHIKGAVTVSDEQAANPGYMSDAGEMSWDLSITKDLYYSVGYGTSQFLIDINAFQMYWHVAGMKSRLSGTVTLNGQLFKVYEDSSAGYQDKNWGSDYTNPWVWVNCNRLFSDKTGELLKMTSLDIGGADPRVLGVSLGRRLIISFYYEGTLYEWNFTKGLASEVFQIIETDDDMRWIVDGKDAFHRIKVDFHAPKSKIRFINYENPLGKKEHNALWNTGWASGTVELYRRNLIGRWSLIESFHGELGGAEYGAH